MLDRGLMNAALCSYARASIQSLANFSWPTHSNSSSARHHALFDTDTAVTTAIHDVGSVRKFLSVRVTGSVDSFGGRCGDVVQSVTSSSSNQLTKAMVTETTRGNEDSRKSRSSGEWKTATFSVRDLSCGNAAVKSFAVARGKERGVHFRLSSWSVPTFTNLHRSGTRPTFSQNVPTSELSYLVSCGFAPRRSSRAYSGILLGPVKGESSIDRSNA